MGNWDNCDAVCRNPDVVSGTWVFRETRVPVAALFENLKDGVSIDDFLACFPGVERSQVGSVLEYEVAAVSLQSMWPYRRLCFSRPEISTVKLNYYPETDSLYIDLCSKPSADSREISEGVVLDYDSQGNLVGIDIDNASKKLDLHEVVTNHIPLASA